MRGLIFQSLLLFACGGCFGQLTVKPSGQSALDTYLYLEHDFLFVQNDLVLFKNLTVGQEPSIYLRKEAMLLQGTPQNKPNSGNGSISIFQTGSSNAYDYNYWGSPVVDPTLNLFGISLLYQPKSQINSLPAQLSPALNGVANPLTISTRWIYTFHGNNYNQWNFIGNNTTIAPGYGFTMKGTDGFDLTIVDDRANNPGNLQRYDFRGKPNSGTINISITAENYVLVGNPYPSVFDLSLFLLENSGNGIMPSNCYGSIQRKDVITGVAYFWDSKENGSSHHLDDYMGGYGAFSPIDPCTDGVYVPPIFKKGLQESGDGSFGKFINRRFLPVAQGFMVQGTQNNNLVFKNSHRTSKKPEPPAEQQGKKVFKEQTSRTLPGVQLQVLVNDSYVRQLQLVFWEKATPQTDKAMDAEAYEVAPTDVGWLHDNKNMVIDVRPFSKEAEIPLFLKVENKVSKMTFSAVISNNELLHPVYLIDTQSDSYFAISEEPYTFVLEPGIYHGRFKIAFTDKNSTEVPQQLPEQVFTEENVSIEHNNENALLIITPVYFDQIQQIGVYDMQGRIMFLRKYIQGSEQLKISTQHWANAIYLVKVSTNNSKKVLRKVTIYNK